MSTPVTLRDARVDDAFVLVSAERLVASQPGYLASHPDEIHPEAFRATIQAFLADGRGKCLVAESEGHIVGHGLLTPMALAATRHIVRLTLVVHKGHEGHGIGKRLMKELIAWAQAEPHVRKIELNVRSTNTRAIGLYRSLGFVEQGRQLDKIRIDDHTFVDDLEMGLFVKPRA